MSSLEAPITWEYQLAKLKTLPLSQHCSYHAQPKTKVWPGLPPLQQVNKGVFAGPDAAGEQPQHGACSTAALTRHDWDAVGMA